MDYNLICTHCMQEVVGLSTGAVCPCCGHPYRIFQSAPHQLRPMTTLQNKYLVGDVLGEGGFGITYVGYDMNLEYKVAVKEFYPDGFVSRNTEESDEMEILSGGSEQAVKAWRSSFLAEARTLAKCTKLPGIVDVRDFFEANNTAYIILEYLEGQTLKAFARQYGDRISAAYLLPLLEPVILSLGEMHRQGLIHRDIAPDNIMLLPDGTMKILDFGSAKNYTVAQDYPVMVKPGFSPEEQYHSDGRQGPWTDVYAMGATIYRLLTGQTPPDAQQRMTQDTLWPPNQYGAGLTAAQEMAIMNALVPDYRFRYQDMESFHAELYRRDPFSSPQMNELINNVGNFGVKAVDKVSGVATEVGNGVARWFKKNFKG